MKQPRKRIAIGVMVPTIIAVIMLRRTMGMPSMNGVPMVDIYCLLLTGALLGIAIAQAFSAFRKTHIQLPQQTIPQQPVKAGA